jgi:hypothetical protein
MNSANVHVFETIERVLIVLAVLLTIYAGALFIREKDVRFAGPMSVTPATTSAPPQGLDAIKPIGSYAEQLARRSIFEFGPVNAGTVPEVGGSTQQLPGNFKIVGILIGRPSEVIIEDTQMQQTYFVKEGDASGPIQVFDVSQNRAVVTYQGQTFEVNLHP